MINLEFLMDILWPILLPFSYLYQIIGGIRYYLYKKEILHSEKLQGYTISVGNIEVGGTGKSPIVMDLCKCPKTHNAKIVILTKAIKAA